MNPYGVRLDGAGDFLRRWEYNAVRFLERAGTGVSTNCIDPAAKTSAPLGAV
jgi:hypothetical protein